MPENLLNNKWENQGVGEENQNLENDNLEKAISNNELLKRLADTGPEGKKFAEEALREKQKRDVNKKAEEPAERDPKMLRGRKRRIIDKSEPMGG